jgi:hypothetical protein
MKGGEKMIESNNFNLKQIEAIAQELTNKYSSNIQLYLDDNEQAFILECNSDSQLHKIIEDAIKALKEAFLVELKADCPVNLGATESGELIIANPNRETTVTLMCI